MLITANWNVFDLVWKLSVYCGAVIQCDSVSLRLSDNTYNLSLSRISENCITSPTGNPNRLLV